jgi:predicted GNAT family N-acyltransferase
MIQEEMSMEKNLFLVKPAAWDSPEGRDLRSIRIRVFVEEQNVPREEEFDAVDLACFHVLAYDEEGRLCGTGRLYADAVEKDLAHIGRMAVLKEARGMGCGAAIMEALILEAERRGFKRVVLSAQEHAIGFYRKLGFECVGERYWDVNIPHILMIRKCLPVPGL